MSPAEVSRESGLSSKALRLYEGRQLLVPAVVDPRNGYRRYGRDQLVVAARIALLREAGVGLADIGRFLEHPTTDVIEGWLRGVDAERDARRRALTELAYSMGLRGPARKEPILAITIRSVASLEELADAFDLAGAQFEPVITRSDERRYEELRSVFSEQRDLLLMAETAERPIGAALGFTSDGRNATLRMIGVVAECRRRGVGGELLRAFERGVVRIGAHSVTLGADEATGFYVRHGYQSLLLLQWVYDPRSFEAEVAAVLEGPLRGMAHRKASFNSVPQLFVTLDEPNPVGRAQVADLIAGAHVGYCMRRDVGKEPVMGPDLSGP